MADNAATHQVLAQLGFNNNDHQDIIDNQGYSGIDELVVLKKEDIVNLCKVVCCLGGTVPNPAAAPVLPAGSIGPPALPPGIPPMIANPGIYIFM